MKKANLYLSNNGSTVELRIRDINIRYVGPKNLVRFYKINELNENVIYVDTVFSHLGRKYIEEDYIDLEDVLNITEERADKIVKSIENIVIIRDRGNFKMGKMTRAQLVDTALSVSDNIALLQMKNRDTVLAVSMIRPGMMTIIKLSDITVIKTNMSNSILDRAVGAVTRNMGLIEEIRKRQRF